MQLSKDPTFFAHDGFLGFLNYSKIPARSFLHDPQQRPPYPVLNPNPTFGQVVQNLNRSDLGFFIAGALVAHVSGFVLAAYATREVPVATNLTAFFEGRQACQRLVQCNLMSWLPAFALLHSYQRLTGHFYNGHEWRFKQNYFRQIEFGEGMK